MLPVSNRSTDPQYFSPLNEESSPAPSPSFNVFNRLFEDNASHSPESPKASPISLQKRTFSAVFPNSPYLNNSNNTTQTNNSSSSNSIMNSILHSNNKKSMNSCLRGNHFSPENQTFNSSFISNSSSLSYYQAPAPSAPKTKTSSSSHTPFFIKAMECTTSQKINKEGTVYDLALQRLRGVHSEVMFFLNNEPSFYENVNNDQLVVKVFNRETFEEQGMKAVEKNLLRYSLNQYEQLSIDYADLPETQKPFAVLYNSETAPENAYIVQEKVAPFQAPLWNINTHINDLSEENKSILDQIKDLFHYSYLLEDKPGLDLKWANIGIRPRSNTVVIFDYYEYDDQFYILAKPFLADLSQSSPSIRNYILEGLLEKCEQTQTSFLSDRYQELTNNNT